MFNSFMYLVNKLTFKHLYLSHSLTVPRGSKIASNTFSGVLLKLMAYKLFVTNLEQILYWKYNLLSQTKSECLI